MYIQDIIIVSKLHVEITKLSFKVHSIKGLKMFKMTKWSLTHKDNLFTIYKTGKLMNKAMRTHWGKGEKIWRERKVIER